MAAAMAGKDGITLGRFAFVDHVIEPAYRAFKENIAAHANAPIQYTKESSVGENHEVCQWAGVLKPNSLCKNEHLPFPIRTKVQAL
ncbi:MAG: hypothetical protein COA78_00615 [Blastopirellula sp.]|nr:MAG: hypothetical protein COA78_00615 [Blastopirellula sp.]